MGEKLEGRAKAYIDEAIQKQRGLGYRGRVPKESYDKAVKQAARVLRNLQRSRAAA
jgi:hypothetical protein